MNKTLKGFMIGLLVGVCFMLTTTSLAETIKEYMLVKAQYPIFVNEQKYESADLPALNYEGSTYIPLRAVGEILSSQIYWNDELRQVEITNGMSSAENEAFRNIEVSGSQGDYTVTGEARVYEATLQYEVEDGHFILQEGFETASAGAPEWGDFTIDIHIPEESLPENGHLRIILFEESAEDGSRIHELAVTLEEFSIP